MRNKSVPYAGGRSQSALLARSRVTFRAACLLNSILAATQAPSQDVVLVSIGWAVRANLVPA